MKKKKEKAKKIYHRLAFWLGVLVLGTIVGVSVQFTRAWVEPSASAPDGNIAAPINTGATKQVKKGTSSNKADICVDPKGTGDEICLGSNVSYSACSAIGGSAILVGAETICKLPGDHCPVHWTQYLYYTETKVNTCGSVSTGSHVFANIDPASEAVSYTTTSTYSYWDGCCYITNSCPPGMWHPIGSWCEDGSSCNGCTKSGTTTSTSICTPTITFVGCVAS